MELNEYQEKAMTTCMDSSRNLSYMLLNLVGEVGEFSSKVAKSIRKGHIAIGGECFHGIVSNSPVIDDDTNWYFTKEELKKEAGDILWQLSGLCTIMEWNLEDVAQTNLNKLAARKEAGTIDGSGDGIIRGK